MRALLPIHVLLSGRAAQAALQSKHPGAVGQWLYGIRLSATELK